MGYAIAVGMLLLILEVSIFSTVTGDFEQIVCSLLFLSLGFSGLGHNGSRQLQGQLVGGLLHDIRKAIASSISDLEQRDQFIADGESELHQVEKSITLGVESIETEVRFDSFIAVVALLNLCRVLLF